MVKYSKVCVLGVQGHSNPLPSPSILSKEVRKNRKKKGLLESKHSISVEPLSIAQAAPVDSVEDPHKRHAWPLP